MLSNKIKRDLVILSFSDLQIDRNFNFNILKVLIDEACKTNPHIICFVGDLVEDANVFNDRHIKGIIFDFFRALTSVAPVYVVRGDHDLLTMEDEKCKSLNSDAFLKILIILAIYMCFLMNQKKLVFLMLVSLVKI